MINPEYANVEILEVAPAEVVDFPNAIFDNMSIGDHPDVIATEKQSGCPETQLENGSFSPQNGPPHGTTAWYTTY